MIGSVYIEIVRIIGGYWICYLKHENVPSLDILCIMSLEYLISRLAIYLKVLTYDKETTMFNIFITSCKSTSVSRKGWS